MLQKSYLNEEVDSTLPLPFQIVFPEGPMISHQQSVWRVKSFVLHDTVAFQLRFPE